jgi:hypothetical protein
VGQEHQQWIAVLLACLVLGSGDVEQAEQIVDLDLHLITSSDGRRFHSIGRVAGDAPVPDGTREGRV